MNLKKAAAGLGLGTVSSVISILGGAFANAALTVRDLGGGERAELTGGAITGGLLAGFLLYQAWQKTSRPATAAGFILPWVLFVAPTFASSTNASKPAIIMHALPPAPTKH